MLADDIKTLLAADSTITTAMTGGVVTYNDIGGQGLSRKSYAQAYDATTGILKPILVIREGRMQTNNAIRDEGAQLTSARMLLRIAMLTDRSNGYTTLETVRRRVYTLIQNQIINGYALIWMERDPEKREFSGDNAAAMIDSYFAYTIVEP